MVDRVLGSLPLHDYDLKWGSLDDAKKVLSIAAGRKNNRKNRKKRNKKESQGKEEKNITKISFQEGLKRNKERTKQTE